MTTPDLIDRARRSLGRVGAFVPNVPFAQPTPIAEQRTAVQRLEQAGFSTAWVNEGVGGKDVFTQVAVLAAAADQITFGTAVANVWARPPQTAHGAAAMLAQAYPGRFVLGLGVGYREQAAAVGKDFSRPLATMRDYLDTMKTPQAMTPAPPAEYARIVAAGGPKMLALAGRFADGALPTLVPPRFTGQARQEIGPDKLLVVALSVAFDRDPDRARSVAREFATNVINRPGSPYAVNLARLGYTSEDLSLPSDRLVDDVIGHGDAPAIAAKVQEHLDAGADHVRISVIADDFTTGVDRLEALGTRLHV